MQRAIRFIPEFVTPLKVLIILSIVFTLILLIQFTAYTVMQDNTIVWQGSCTFKEWNESGDLGMAVDCGSHGEGMVTDTSFIRSYLNNPGPLACEISATDNISCEHRPQPEGDNG